MLIHIQDVLPPETIAALAELATAQGVFTPGTATAAGRARRVKNNLQANSADRRVRGALKTVEAAVLKNPVFQAAARPRELVRLMLNRYDSGMGYGAHIDAPLMDGVRTDLSFTLFLSAPESYEGGHLVLEMGHGREAVKLPAGSLVLYPTRYLHQVEPVRRGSRLAAVGWVRSLVRDESRRDLLFELDQAMAELRNGHTAEGLGQLGNVQANLLRLWVDD